MRHGSPLYHTNTRSIPNFSMKARLVGSPLDSYIIGFPHKITVYSTGIVSQGFYIYFLSHFFPIQIGEEDKKPQEKVVWDGHSASMERVTQKARDNIGQQMAAIQKARAAYVTWL